MSWSRYSACAKHAIAVAQHEVEQQGGNQVDAEHILLGVVFEQDTAAASVLRYLGVQPEQVEACLRPRLLPAVRADTFDSLHLSPSALTIVNAARDEADRLRSSSITTTHLMIGILSVKQPSVWNIFPSKRAKPSLSLAATVLHEMGVTRERIEHAMKGLAPHTLLRMTTDPGNSETLLHPVKTEVTTPESELLRASEEKSDPFSSGNKAQTGDQH